MEAINYSKEIQELARLGGNVKSYYSEVVRNTARNKLRAVAESYGFSFVHWELTGRWQTYTELETVETVKDETVTLRIETVKHETETVKMPNKGYLKPEKVETLSETVCQQCMKRIETGRKTKRFCDDKCRVRFNNARR